jgi:Yip1-like protein/TIR domain-containing protein
MWRKRHTIFISYRRDDGGGYVGRLYDNLSARYGSTRLFMDIDSIAPGQDFVRVLDEAVKKCTVLLVVIGKRWEGIDAKGRPRIQNPTDFVRLEIATALRRVPTMKVIPVLIQGATVPSPESLPEDIRDMTRRQAFELNDRRWKEGVAELTAALERPEPAMPPARIDTSTQPLPGELARVFNTFTAPTKTFNDLRRNPAWWGPFVLLALLSTAWVFAVDKKIGFEKVLQNEFKASHAQAERLNQLPEDARTRMFETQSSLVRNVTYANPILSLIWNLIVAAILLATFRLGFRAEIRFKTALSILMYASLPLMLKSLVALEVVAGASPDSFSIQNPVATNPGYFLNPAQSIFWYRLMSALDVFMIWTLLLTGIGFACVCNLRRRTASVVVFGWYAAWTLASASLGGLGL